MIAYTYPLLSVFLTIFMFFAFVGWLYLVVIVLADLFRSPASGLEKALWTLAVILLPLIGVLIYLIARGKGMGERAAARAYGSSGIPQL